MDPFSQLKTGDDAYDGSGYIFTYPKWTKYFYFPYNNYSKRYAELEKLVDDLKHINWLDHDTRALIM